MARGKEVVATDSGEITAAEDAWKLEAKGIDFVPKTFEEMEEFFASEGGILTFEGSAYSVLDKDKLIGVPFMIADVRFWHSDKYDREAVSVMLLTKTTIEDKDHFVINDGSTGIYEQVKQMVQSSGRKAGIMCPNGLRVSEYDTVVHDEFGNEPDKTIKSRTFYVQ